MKALENRVSEMERQSGADWPQRWLRIMQEAGQNREAAIADYEAQHGPIASGVGRIFRQIVDSPSAGETALSSSVH